MQDKPSVITKAIRDVQNQLNKYALAKDKRANLLAYWLSDYMHFLNKEDSFDPKKLKRYKRGEIIKVHLGYNIGSEQGGLHYAVILDVKNPISSNTVTIVPLSSLKKNKDIKWSQVSLGDTIYFQLNEKLSKQETILNNNINAFTSEIEKLRKEVTEDTHEQLYAAQVERAERITELNKNIDEQKRIQKNNLKLKRELSHMKEGSIALVDQITTVSKIRIYDPLHGSDVLSGIRLSPKLLDLIDEKIQELYLGKSIDT